jgi:hypothetical protein
MIKRTIPATRKSVAAAQNPEKISDVIVAETTNTNEPSIEPIASAEKTHVVKKALVTRRMLVKKPSPTVVKTEDILDKPITINKQEKAETMKDSDKEKTKKAKTKEKEKKEKAKKSTKAKKEKQKEKEKENKQKAKKKEKEKKAKAKKAKAKKKAKSKKKK